MHNFLHFVFFSWIKDYFSRYISSLRINIFFIKVSSRGISVSSHPYLSPLTHPRAVPNLYDFLSSAELKRRYWLQLCRQKIFIFFRFGMTWGWVNNKWLLSLRSIAKVNLPNSPLAARNAAVQAAASRMHVGSMCWRSCSVCWSCWARLHASALWYEGYVVVLQCCWALQCAATAYSSLSCPDLCQLTLTLPLTSLRTSVEDAED